MSGIFPKTLIGSPLNYVIAAASLIPLVIVYFLLLQIPIWNNWNIPLNQTQMDIASAFFGLWAMSAYSLTVVVVAAASFIHGKFDLVLFGMRFMGRMVQLFFIIDFILIVFSPYIWASFFLLIAAAASYFILKFAEFRTDVSVKIKDRSLSLSTQGSRIDVPLGGRLQLRVAGARVADFSVTYESAGGQTKVERLSYSHNEGQWQVGNIPIITFPSSISVLYKEDKIRTLRAEQTMKFITNVHFAIYIRNHVALPDGVIENLKMSVDRSLTYLFNEALTCFNNYFSEINLQKAKFRVYQEGRLLNLNEPIFENGIADGSKIEIHAED